MSSKSVYFQVSNLINLTTEMSMIQIKEGERVEATEYDRDHICFEVEPKSCAQGQLVKIQGTIRFVDDLILFSGLGKVLKIQALQNSKLKIVVELRSFDKEIWNRFVNAMKERQGNIDKLFSAMRGDE